MEKLIDQSIEPILSASAVKKRTFLYERELLLAAQIDRFSDKFRFLFHRTYMGLLFFIAIAADACFFYSTDDLLVFNNHVNVYTVIGLLVFLIGSSFFHELGHASACKFFGVRHGGIGFGLYLNFPVLYTDVTEVWKLRRGQRCVVNLAGVYFQSYWLILLLSVFFLTGNDIVRYLILIMNLGFVMTLNPFFKFDGYWIASDLLGVPNLRQRSLELFSYAWNKLRKRSTGKLPYLLQIRRLERYGLLVYSIVVNFFMGYYFLYIIPTFLYRFVQTFPDAVSELILYLSNQMVPPFALQRAQAESQKAALEVFTRRLLVLHPHLSELELRICCLIKTGIPVSQIAQLLNRSTPAITAARTRMYKKLTGKEGKAEQTDQLIMGL